MKKYKNINSIFVLSIVCILIVSCSSIREVKKELTGSAKPEGGVSESIPPTKSFAASHGKIWQASQEILDAWGYLYEANQSTNMIKTEPKYLNDTSKFRIIGSDYAAKLYITVKESKVTFRARFNKKSNLVQGTENAEYPEKENDLRKLFFDAMSEKIGV